MTCLYKDIHQDIQCVHLQYESRSDATSMMELCYIINFAI